MSALLCAQGYAAAFFDKKLSGIANYSRQVRIVEPPVFSPLSRTNSSFHFSWTYDSQVTFNLALA